MSRREFDIIVVGAGHAGCEAAGIAAKLGRRVACVTFDLAHIGRLSCNPAVGGQGKGQLVREIDALGGFIGRVADRACVQFRRLNTRKGLAVQASRAQVDIARYPAEMVRALGHLPSLTFLSAEVAGVRTVGGRVVGVTLADGNDLDAPAVILTTGTFLGGVMHRGSDQAVGGRVGDRAAHALSRSLAELGLRLGRLKTGTVPRLDGRTIAWDRLTPQTDTVPDGRFSYAPPGPRLPTITCYEAYTHPGVHDVIRANLHRSPMTTGAISGRGPRYCPSIEDKVVRFADRDRHLLFLEPEGLDTTRVYVNGMSTSLPADVQDAMVHGITGLEDAQIVQHGYAVEYDYSDPTQLGPDLQVRHLPGLFLAGQINGTSGYEEAAGQGLVAGLSAGLGRVFHVERRQGYLGVLVDDLVTKGVGGEPYRMFTSRAEHRLLLREDNADRRLMPIGRSLGLIDDPTWRAFEDRAEAYARGQACLDAAVTPTAATAERLAAAGLDPIRGPTTGRGLLARPEVGWSQLAAALDLPSVPPDVALALETDAKYGGYVARAERRAALAQAMDDVALPTNLGWLDQVSLSTEVRHRIRFAPPATLGQMARMPGMTPAAVAAVAAWLARTAD